MASARLAPRAYPVGGLRGGLAQLPWVYPWASAHSAPEHVAALPFHSRLHLASLPGESCGFGFRASGVTRSRVPMTAAELDRYARDLDMECEERSAEAPGLVSCHRGGISTAGDGRTATLAHHYSCASID